MNASSASTFQAHGLSASFNAGLGPPHTRHHHHNEFELLFMRRGAASHEHGGRAFAMPLRRLIVLWGGIAHRTRDLCHGTETWAVHIPIGIFLGWGLPRKTFVHPLLRGEVFCESNAQSAESDAPAMRRWLDDINGAAAPAAAAILHAALLHELQGRLLRFALSNSGVRMDDAASERAPGAIARMLQYIAENYQDPALSVARIARHARIHPSYAINHFHKTCGVSLMRYVIRQRVTHAQCLIASGDGKILDIALDSGFGSESRFYQVFRAATGVTPREYARHPAPPADVKK